MHIISSGSAFLQALLALHKAADTEYAELVSRLGVKPPDGRIVVIIIASDEWRAHTAFIDLLEDCEKKFGKQIDTQRIRYVACKDIERARLNPNLEIANFILMADEDLLDASSYPELEQILPFL